jgi:spermidine/putrescine transport system permease protein
LGVHGRRAGLDAHFFDLSIPFCRGAFFCRARSLRANPVGIFGWSPTYLYIFGRSLYVAFWVTVISIALSYPLSFYICRLTPRGRLIALSLIIIPMCTNLVIRTYAWELLLSPQLPPAQLCAYLGLIPEGRALYPGTFAVYLGMISYSLPYALLPLYTNIERLDWSIAEAARDLYASDTRVFLKAILPQTWPGLSVAVLLSFVPAMGMFVVTNRLGGANFMLVGNLIQQQFGASRDYPFGAAISLVLIVLTLVGLYFYRRQDRKVELL